MTTNSYEVVYSAALERQGRGISLSGATGNSTLLAFAAVETWAHGEAHALYRSLRNHESQMVGHNKRWHGNRSKRTS